MPINLPSKSPQTIPFFSVHNSLIALLLLISISYILFYIITYFYITFTIVPDQNQNPRSKHSCYSENRNTEFESAVARIIDLPLFAENREIMGEFIGVYFQSFDVLCFDRMPVWQIFYPTRTTANVQLFLYKSSILKIEAVENIDLIDLQLFSQSAIN